MQRQSEAATSHCLTPHHIQAAPRGEQRDLVLSRQQRSLEGLGMAQARWERGRQTLRRGTCFLAFGARSEVQAAEWAEAWQRTQDICCSSGCCAWKCCSSSSALVGSKEVINQGLWVTESIQLQKKITVSVPQSPLTPVYGPQPLTTSSVGARTCTVLQHEALTTETTVRPHTKRYPLTIKQSVHQKSHPRLWVWSWSLQVPTHKLQIP